MAALDASDSDDSDSNQSDKEFEYVDLPVNKDMHHSTATAAVTIAPAAITIAPLTPSPSVSAAVAAPDKPTVTLDTRDDPIPHTSNFNSTTPHFYGTTSRDFGRS
jgi:hypothetical protein